MTTHLFQIDQPIPSQGWNAARCFYDVCVAFLYGDERGFDSPTEKRRIFVAPIFDLMKQVIERQTFI